MKITVVVPVSRPENIQATVENFLRQRYPDKRLMLVLNGPALDAEVPAGVMRRTSAAHQSAARNVALRELRDEDAFVAFCDDDDYYGPGYLEELARFAKRGRITGKYPHWILFSRGLVLCNRGRASRRTDWVRGGTVAGFARDIPDWPEVLVGEELLLCESFRATGGEVYSLGLGHTVYYRTGRNTLVATELAILHTFWPAERHPARSWALVDLDEPPPVGAPVDLSRWEGIPRLDVLPERPQGGAERREEP